MQSQFYYILKLKLIQLFAFLILSEINILKAEDFLSLPHIQIFTGNQTIGDDYIPAQFILTDSNQVIKGTAGVRLRGDYTNLKFKIDR